MPSAMVQEPARSRLRWAEAEAARKRERSNEAPRWDENRWDIFIWVFTFRIEGKGKARLPSSLERNPRRNKAEHKGSKG